VREGQDRWPQEPSRRLAHQEEKRDQPGQRSRHAAGACGPPEAPVRVRKARFVAACWIGRRGQAQGEGRCSPRSSAMLLLGTASKGPSQDRETEQPRGLTHGRMNAVPCASKHPLCVKVLPHGVRRRRAPSKAPRCLPSRTVQQSLVLAVHVRSRS
jgi:hypothetical protein